jgi:hypothetical protein
LSLPRDRPTSVTRAVPSACQWPRSSRPHICMVLPHVAAISQREKFKLSSRKPPPRREAYSQLAQHAKFVTADEEGRGEVRRKAQIRPQSTRDNIISTNKHNLSSVTFMRDARAPASGHSTHFNPQHWPLCHMGLY